MEDHLATKIKEARQLAGLSREQVAVGLGVSLATVVRYETGRTKRISFETLLAIGRVTEQPLDFFMEGLAA
jgi:transcriptional regulator with XRE-family HTH domain